MYYNDNHYLLSSNRLLDHILILVISMIKLLRIPLFARIRLILNNSI